MMKKRLGVILLIISLVISFVPLGQTAAIADQYDLVETLAEFKQLEREHPPYNGIYWNYFSALGSYSPIPFPSKEFLYENNNRIYSLRIDAVEEYMEHAPSFWDEYREEMDTYSAFQYIRLILMSINADYTVIKSENMQSDNMAEYKSVDAEHTLSHCLDGRIVYVYSQDGLETICWLYEGYLYQLSVRDLSYITVAFDRTDIRLVRELVTTDTCYGALATLMERLSEDAVWEMNIGTYVEEPSGGDHSTDGSDMYIEDDGQDGEIEEDDSEIDLKTDIDDTWLVIWSVVGVLVVIGVIVIIIDIVREKKRR